MLESVLKAVPSHILQIKLMKKTTSTKELNLHKS